MSDFQSLHPRWVTLQRIGGLITLLVVGAPTLVGALVLTFVDLLPGFWRLAPGAAWIALMILLIWAGLIFPPIAYRHIRYKVTDLGVEVRQGVFWKHIINVPRSRVQHTDVRQGPFQRRYSVGTLVMHTAGTTNHTVVLDGLPHDRALAIRDSLLHDKAESKQEREREHTDAAVPSTTSPCDAASAPVNAADTTEDDESDRTPAPRSSPPDHLTPGSRGDDA